MSKILANIVCVICVFFSIVTRAEAADRIDETPSTIARPQDYFPGLIRKATFTDVKRRGYLTPGRDGVMLRILNREVVDELIREDSELAKEEKPEEQSSGIVGAFTGLWSSAVERAGNTYQKFISKAYQSFRLEEDEERRSQQFQAVYTPEGAYECIYTYTAPNVLRVTKPYELRVAFIEQDPKKAALYAAGYIGDSESDESIRAFFAKRQKVSGIANGIPPSVSQKAFEYLKKIVPNLELNVALASRREVEEELQELRKRQARHERELDHLRQEEALRQEKLELENERLKQIAAALEDEIDRAAEQKAALTFALEEASKGIESQQEALQQLQAREREAQQQIDRLRKEALEEDREGTGEQLREALAQKKKLEEMALLAAERFREMNEQMARDQEELDAMGKRERRLQQDLKRQAKEREALEADNMELSREIDRTIAEAYESKQAARHLQQRLEQHEDRDAARSSRSGDVEIFESQ